MDRIKVAGLIAAGVALVAWGWYALLGLSVLGLLASLYMLERSADLAYDGAVRDLHTSCGGMMFGLGGVLLALMMVAP